MQSTVFVVNDEPYCLWEEDIQQKNVEFLSGFDPDYFDYGLATHSSTEDEQRAAVALRVCLHHALETLFSLIGAFVQAPDCVYAWIAKCSNKELRGLVIRLLEGGSDTFTKLNIPTVSLPTISRCVFHSYEPGTEKQARSVELFAKLWARLAREFTDPNHVDEYNALKHGFRVKRGGFKLEIGVESRPGVAPPETEMKLLGASDFGATLFKLKTVGSDKTNRSIRSYHLSLNWSIERTVLLLQLCHVSINNLIAALLVVNGHPPSVCKFMRPKRDEDFDGPWQHSTGVTSLSFDKDADESSIQPLSKQDILAMIAARHGR